MDLQDFAPYKVLEVENLFSFKIIDQDYILIGLSNGMILVFNLYPSIFGQNIADAVRI